MGKPYLPDHFHTKVSQHAFVVSTPKGEILASYNLRCLSDMFLSGTGRISPAERAVAGAAMSHLIALQKPEKKK
jgi:hypothetical protein